MENKPKFRQKQKVDNFILEEPLGGGQDGEVWRATRISIGKSCAIKFLNSVDDAEKKARFDREITILASLDDAHIVQIQDKGEGWNPDSGDIVPYYVMEFLPGRPIHKMLKDLPPETRLEAFCILFQQVCSALDAAHARGISHGDLKPANILVAEKERLAKISDFGFGLLPGDLKEQRDNYPNSSYRAPKTLTPTEADVYRLGKTLSECVGYLLSAEESLSTRRIESLATRMSDHPADITLTEAISILEQVRTTTLTKAVLPLALSEEVPELALPSEANKLIHDPIHGIREFSSRTIRLINLRFFQRLRRIGVFSSAHLVYPSLTISAFEQGLGDHAMLIRQLESLARATNLREILSPTQLSTTILGGLLLSSCRMPFHSPLSAALGDEIVTLEKRLFEVIEPEISDLRDREWQIDPTLLTQLLVKKEHRVYPWEEADRSLRLIGTPAWSIERFLARLGL